MQSHDTGTKTDAKIEKIQKAPEGEHSAATSVFVHSVVGELMSFNTHTAGSIQ